MTGESDTASTHAWLVLAFGEQRQYSGNIGYKDDPERVYRYDSFVPNHKRLSPGDVLVIVGKPGLIGFARIENIEKSPGHKRFFRCPLCRTSAIKKRKRTQLPFRCDRGHQFEEPNVEDKECVVYAASYSNTFVQAKREIPVQVLRAACPRYSDQLAIQRFEFERIKSEALASAPGLETLLMTSSNQNSDMTVELRGARISRNHVLAAIREVDQHGFPPRNRARLYELVQEDKRYPAKYVLSLAVDRATGKSNSFRTFSGGETFANRVLRKLNFTIERIGSTAELIEDLIASKASETPESEFDPRDIADARERVAAEIFKRRGQPRFRRKLLKLYAGRCAITGCSAAEVLEACHIIPYRGPKTNHPSNGLLLRSDLHTLFDLGLITIDSKDMTVDLDPCLRGTEYAELHGEKLRLPTISSLSPSAAALEEHRKRAKSKTGS